MDWAGLPDELQAEDPAPENQPSAMVAAIFGATLSNLVAELGHTKDSSPEAARLRLAELVPDTSATCLASSALGPAFDSCIGGRLLACHSNGRTPPEIAAILAASGQPKDERPCIACGDNSR